ncbi:ATP-binding cassette domain-containing protein [Sinimarinibacterium sp. CAU 1509]|uniref:ATP-binding cassette domain-containing protein n=1 Tax=Sinimarinibacterium sp. CAU 1509 TaxID=2562283 RepID=UPI0010ABEA65|nr:ATP-binding cassette domain-containing protein [Sinimarinibacterium sp. CAU 1509]TJY59316.1 ATP-binding cassette domain-containing protein [Sinimarinibacterium sp. CAU 1509]
MISLSRATLRRGARTLLENTSFTLFAGWRVGVVGRNGTGKSSLFAALQGELAPDVGEVNVPRHLTIASVAQEAPALPDPAIESVLDGDAELRELERRLAEAEAAHDAIKIGAIHERLDAIGGYAARARAGRLLHGLGFAPEQQELPVSSFSGGWRMRLNLARALMCRSDLLLLDEPTNHLDLDTVIWLQSWLVTYPGTLLVISHDREFLDAVSTHTLHLERNTATLYTGNYSQFERQRAEKLSQQAAAYTQQQERIAHLESFISRFKAKASKARQAQSRVKALERMELVAPAHWDSEFSFEFPEPDKLPSPLVRFDKVSVGYGDKAILSGLRVLIAPGERIGLLGPNGAGKSTLVQTIAGKLAPLSGDVMRSPDLKIGYFAQHQLEQLDPKASPILHLRRIDPKATEQQLRDFLGGFNFRGDRAFEAVAPFSGGEKARLALAMVVYQRPNLLLLDEPTNHLDLDMRHALETALATYAGAVILVSHDRHMLNATCDDFWRVAQGRCEPFDGDLEDYARWLSSAGATTPAPSRAASTAPASKAAVAAQPAQPSAAERRERLKPLRETVKKLDTRMARLQKRLAEIDTALLDPALYEAARHADAAHLHREQFELKTELATLEEQWLAAAEEIEALQA